MEARKGTTNLVDRWRRFSSPFGPLPGRRAREDMQLGARVSAGRCPVVPRLLEGPWKRSGGNAVWSDGGITRIDLSHGDCHIGAMACPTTMPAPSPTKKNEDRKRRRTHRDMRRPEQNDDRFSGAFIVAGSGRRKLGNHGGAGMLSCFCWCWSATIRQTWAASLISGTTTAPLRRSTRALETARPHPGTATMIRSSKRLPLQL